MWAVVGGVSLSLEVRPSLRAQEFSQQDRSWWSFQPVRAGTLPPVGNRQQVRTAIDRFILARLEPHGLRLSPDADRRTLIRRLTFDLTGLPPTPAAVHQFLQDARPDAYDRLVDRLLASPQYGIRWGRHWLDVARYADTNGGGFDYVYPNAWQYRDYVVRAWNADKPYDRFIIEQIAGDLLPKSSDASEIEKLRATGFLALAPKGLGMQDKERMIMDVVDDQIDVVGRSLLGLTLSCARCHNHKFDPIPTLDYYSLAGIFRSSLIVIDTDQNPSYWRETPLVTAASRQAAAKRQQLLTRLQKKLSQERAAADRLVLQAARMRLADYVLAATKIYHSPLAGSPVAHWTFDARQGVTVAAKIGPDGKLANVAGKRELPKRVAGRMGGALQFAGQRDVVRLPAKQSQFANFGKTDDFTVSFWLRTAPGYTPRTADSILSAAYGNGQTMWFVALRPGSYNGIYLRHYDGARATDTRPRANRLAQLVDGGWHHVAFVSQRKGTARVYIDGKLAGSQNIASVSSNANYTNPASILIGASTNAFRGSLDDVAIWDRLLSVDEISRIHRAGRKGADVASLRPMGKGARQTFTYGDAAKQGLVPSIVKRFVGLLRKSRSSPAAPFHRLTARDGWSLTAVAKLVSSAQIKQIVADKKMSPFQLGSGFISFYQAKRRNSISALEDQVERLKRVAKIKPQMAMVMSDVKKPRDLRVHLFGDRTQLGQVARRGFPQILAGKQRRIQSAGSGRLELARWIARPANPLTGRVMANRVWQHFFGKGLVPTPDNFGRLGQRPTHPRLLDWLASRFAADWSIKRLHRQIVLSTTYRQSSQLVKAAAKVDSGNKLLWRMNRRRLQAEAIRDAILASSGQIDLQMNGTINTWKGKMFSVDDANNETANYKTNRRSIYLPVVRGAAVQEVLQLFDFGDPNSVTPQRDNTTVSPQALFMLNSPMVLKQSQLLAKRLQRYKSTDERINRAYWRVLSRGPSPSELKRARAFLRDAGKESWTLFCQSLMCLNEFIYLD